MQRSIALNSPTQRICIFQLIFKIYTECIPKQHQVLRFCFGNGLSFQEGRVRIFIHRKQINFYINNTSCVPLHSYGNISVIPIENIVMESIYVPVIFVY